MTPGIIVKFTHHQLMMLANSGKIFCSLSGGKPTRPRGDWSMHIFGGHMIKKKSIQLKNMGARFTVINSSGKMETSGGQLAPNFSTYIQILRFD
jgi:hypothetical protein